MGWEYSEYVVTNRDDSMAVCVCEFNCDESVDDLAAIQTDLVYETPDHTKRVLWKSGRFFNQN